MSSCMNDNFFQQPQTLGGEITTYTYVYIENIFGHIIFFKIWKKNVKEINFQN